MNTASQRLFVFLVGMMLCLEVACGTDVKSNAPSYNGMGGTNNGSTQHDASSNGSADAGSSVQDASGNNGTGGRDASASYDTSSAVDAAGDATHTNNTPRPDSASLGAPCSADSDCPSGQCASVGGALRGVCTVACDEDHACPSGWSCKSVYSGDGKFCSCESSPEICDGIDNDCDGLVDEGDSNSGLCDEDALCLSNRCECPSGFMCGDECADLFRDADNCGSCGNQCQVACSDSACVQVTQLSVGSDHVCVTLSDGQVRCAGDNAHGQLGNGTTASSDRPVDALWMNHATKVVAADQFSCALTEPGGVYCWGVNAQGQVAEPPLTERHRPTPWQQINAAVDVDAQNYTGCAVTAPGGVRCWGPHGYAIPSLIDGLTNVIQVAVGAYHRCALLAAGQVACWGNNAQGQLGDGTTHSREDIALIASLSGAAQVVAGEEHTCVRLNSGHVKCFGSNSDGQLGVDSGSPLGGLTTLLTPGTVSGLSGATDIAAGAHHSCAVTGDHKVYCWGANDSGQLGDGTTTASNTPIEVHGLPDAQDVDAGGQTSCALTTAGEVYCWGERFGVNPRRLDF